MLLSDDDRSGEDLGGHILRPHGGVPRVRLMFSRDSRDSANDQLDI